MGISKKKSARNSDTGITIDVNLMIKVAIFFGVLLCGYFVGRIYEHDKAVIEGRMYAEEKIKEICPLSIVEDRTSQPKVNITWNNTILS